jgi:hypothetical protein
MEDGRHVEGNAAAATTSIVDNVVHGSGRRRVSKWHWPLLMLMGTFLVLASQLVPR